jgi:2-polyprenyl-6-methoxyphenol hydroxylase-like FAD-dependent oxidoreductase
MYDVIVVGARCAGSPTAMLLARKGYRVLLVDKATFPSDTMSGHFIHTRGVACLKRWGLLEQLAATNCPAITRKTLDFGTFSLVGSEPPSDGVAVQYAPRRTVIDQILVKAAVEAAAELREGFTVQKLLMEGERVTGIRGCYAQDELVTEQATLVIGADGTRSLVARAVGSHLSQQALFHLWLLCLLEFYSYRRNRNLSSCSSHHLCPSHQRWQNAYRHSMAPRGVSGRPPQYRRPLYADAR